MREQQTRRPRRLADSAKRLSRRGPSLSALIFSRFFPRLTELLRSRRWRVERSLGAAVFLVMLVVSLRWEGFAVVVAALVGVATSAWAARRNGEERRPWLLLALAFFSLAAGRLASDLFVFSGPLVAGMTVADLGTFGFSISLAMCNVAWPEIRRSPSRSVATLVDTVTLVAAAAVWGWAGFPPLGALLPPTSATALARSADLLLPVITACVAAPQLTSSRRSSALVLAGGAGFLLLTEVLSSPETAGAGANFVAALTQAAGFALLIATIVSARSLPTRAALLDDYRANPPFPAPGILGVIALIVAAVGLPRVGSPMPLLLVALAGCLGLREVLRIIERRRATERLTASLGLEARLLALQSQIGPDTAPNVALRQSCALAVEVLKADAALAWLVEDETLVLAAAAPERRESLVGRRLSVGDQEALASRVFRSGTAEACSLSEPDARSNRFLTTVLDAESLLGVPITHEASARGVLVLVRESGKPVFTAFDQQKAALVAGQAAASLRRFELYGELESRLSETTLVHRFVVQAVALRTVNDVGWLLLESIRSRVAFDGGRVYLTDGGGFASFRPIAHFANRGPAAIDSESETAWLRLPLLYGERAMGYVDLHRSGERPFTPAEERLAGAIAQQAAVAVQNIRLRDESGKVAMYREVDRLKTELLNNVSHDLRGPLTNIKLAATSLMESINSLTPAEQLEELRDIEDEADRLRDLLEHLLDLSRMEGGALRIDMQRVDLARVARELIAGLERPGFTFICHLRDVHVLGDSRRLRQLLANLLENAVKYSPDGGTITVAASERQGEVEVSVADQGVGIPRHQWDGVFRPYQRADTGKAAAVAGNGLGLAICKGIVEAHGGRIWVESEPGTGTTFSFTVPRAPRLIEPVDLPEVGATV